MLCSMTRVRPDFSAHAIMSSRSSTCRRRARRCQSPPRYLGRVRAPEAMEPVPKDRSKLRTGYTTGACAAAAAKAATRCLVANTLLREIETTLPNRARVTFALQRCELRGERAVCSVIKDAGDD